MSYAPGGRRMVSLGKVHAPKPVNLPSQRRENNGNDPNVSIVPRGSSGSSCWNTVDNAHGGAQHTHGGTPPGSGPWGHKAAEHAPPRPNSGQPEAPAPGPGAAWGGAGLPERRPNESPGGTRWTGDFPQLGKDGEVLKGGVPGPSADHPTPPYPPPPYGGRGEYGPGPGDAFPKGEQMGRGPPPPDYYRQEHNSNYRHPPGAYDRRYPMPGPYMHPQGGFPPPPPPPPPPADRERDRDRDRERPHDMGRPHQRSHDTGAPHHRPPYPPQQQHGYGPGYYDKWGNTGGGGGGGYGRGPSPQNWQSSGRFHSPGRNDYRAGHQSRDGYGGHSTAPGGRFERDGWDHHADRRAPHVYPHRGEQQHMPPLDGDPNERPSSTRDIALRRDREPPPAISLHDHGDHDWSKMVEEDDISRLPTPKFPDMAVDAVEGTAGDSGKAGNPLSPSPRMTGPPKILTRQSSPGEIAAAAAAGAAAAAAAAPEGEVHAEAVPQSGGHPTPTAMSPAFEGTSQAQQSQPQPLLTGETQVNKADVYFEATQQAQINLPAQASDSQNSATTAQKVQAPPPAPPPQAERPSVTEKRAQKPHAEVKQVPARKPAPQTKVVLVERSRGPPPARSEGGEVGTTGMSLDQQKAFMQARAKERAEVKRAEEERQRGGVMGKRREESARPQKSGAQNGSQAEEPPRTEREPKQRGNRREGRERREKGEQKTSDGDRMSMDNQSLHNQEQQSREKGSGVVGIQGSSAAGPRISAAGKGPAVMVVPRRPESAQQPVEQSTSVAHVVPASLPAQPSEGSEAQQVQQQTQARQQMMPMMPPTPQQQLMLQHQLLQMQLAQQHGLAMVNGPGKFSAPMGQSIPIPSFPGMPTSQASTQGVPSSSVPLPGASGPAGPMTIGVGMGIPMPPMLLGPNMPVPLNMSQQMALQQHLQQQQQQALRHASQQGTQQQGQHSAPPPPPPSQHVQTSLPAQAQQPLPGMMPQMQPQVQPQVQVQNASIHEKQKQQGVGQQGGQEQQRVQIVTVPSSTSGGHSQQGKNGARPGADARGRIERAGKPVGAGKRGGGRAALTTKPQAGDSAAANDGPYVMDKGKPAVEQSQRSAASKNSAKHSGRMKGAEQKQGGPAEGKTGPSNGGSQKGGGGKDARGSAGESPRPTSSAPPGLGGSNTTPTPVQVQPIPAKASGKAARGGGRSGGGVGRGRGGRGGGQQHHQQQSQDGEKPEAAGEMKVRTVHAKLKEAVKEAASSNRVGGDNGSKGGNSRAGSDGGRGGGQCGERGGRTARGGRRGGGRSGQGRSGRGTSAAAPPSQSAPEAPKPS